MTWTQQTYTVGEWDITPLSDGFFRLDGGSMWGVVPANLWRKLTPPAEDNTIQLAVRPFLLVRGEGADRLVVVLEPGIGERWEERWRGIYHMVRDDTLVSTLAACGIAPEDVTHVIGTHCHWDHIGALVVERDGVLVPQFPKSKHRFPSIEVEMTRAPGHARKASYRHEDIEAVEEAGLLEVFDASLGDGEEGVEILPGLRMHTLGGHSDGSSLLTINADGEGETAVFWGDVVPTSHHIQPAFIMAYDIDVVRSFEQRSKWIARASEGDWLNFYYHDEHFAAGRISKPERRYVSAPL
jgi:glyoxylase-like metal-dependent hydrolase (beta-lactamase superfamily II)